MLKSLVVLVGKKHHRALSRQNQELLLSSQPSCQGFLVGYIFRTILGCPSDGDLRYQDLYLAIADLQSSTFLTTTVSQQLVSSYIPPTMTPPHSHTKSSSSHSASVSPPTLPRHPFKGCPPSLMFSHLSQVVCWMRTEQPLQKDCRRLFL